MSIPALLSYSLKAHVLMHDHAVPNSTPTEAAGGFGLSYLAFRFHHFTFLFRFPIRQSLQAYLSFAFGGGFAALICPG